MDAATALEGVRQRIRLLEARLRKPTGAAVSSREIDALNAARNEEERLLKLIETQRRGG